MSDEVVVALITGFFGLLGTVIAAWMGKRKGQASAKTKYEEEIAESTESLQDQFLERFGWKAERVVSRGEMTNTNGDLVLQRSWFGVRPGPGMTITYVPGRFWTTTPGSDMNQLPNLTGVDAYPKGVTLVQSDVSKTSCKYRVEIDGGLTAEDPPLDFHVDIGFRRSILMSQASVTKAYAHDPFKKDYHAFDVEIPVDHLTLEIIFPKDLGFKVFPIVFFWNSELTNDRELQRVKGGFRRTEQGGLWEVERPYLGFRYALYWIAPP